jgi:hypothetical protein
MRMMATTALAGAVMAAAALEPQSGRTQTHTVPMYCAARVMSGSSRNYYVTGVFYGDYDNNLAYRNRFSEWVNANYGNMVSWATYCWYADTVEQAYRDREHNMNMERIGGSEVISTRWRG